MIANKHAAEGRAPADRKGAALRRFCTALAILLLSGAVYAADPGPAKSAGQIGEREDGYIGFVTEAAADVRALVQEVNDQRRAEYERIAQANGITREQVELLAGRKAIEKTPSGQFVHVGGSWQKKP